MITSVRHILQKKSANFVGTISPNASVFDAVQKFSDLDLGALIVTEGNRVLGVVSERDYARKVALAGRSSRTTTVREIMQTEIPTVGLNDCVESCMELMVEKFIRHVPVVENGQLVGVVSIGDIVKAAWEEQQTVIDDLVCYVTDTPRSSEHLYWQASVSG